MAPRIKNLNRALVNDAVGAFARSLPSASVVLDVGAGSGHYRGLFSRQRYLAIDCGYEQEAISGLSAVADIAAIPFADAAIDAALCVEVLEHVRDPLGVLGEILRVLRPGGRALISTPFCLGEHMQPHDFHRYTRFGLTTLFEQSGFRIVSIEPRGGYFTLLAYLLARVPDELFRGSCSWRKVFKPLARLLTTYTLAPLVRGLDVFDQRRNFSLGFNCLVEKP